MARWYSRGHDRRRVRFAAVRLDGSDAKAVRRPYGLNATGQLERVLRSGRDTHGLVRQGLPRLKLTVPPRGRRCMPKGASEHAAPAGRLAGFDGPQRHLLGVCQTAYCNEKVSAQRPAFSPT